MLIVHFPLTYIDHSVINEYKFSIKRYLKISKSLFRMMYKPFRYLKLN